MMVCNFSFSHYAQILSDANRKGYKFLTCRDLKKIREPTKPFVVIRHDIDVDRSPEKLVKMAEIENMFGVKTTYFVRMHAEDYNPFGFLMYDALKKIISMCHEIGLHEEATDFSKIFNENAAEVIARDKALLEDMLGSTVYGVSSHSDFTGFNNLDLWKSCKPEDFGFEYHAYEDVFFKNSTYVSDSLGKWKSYKNGVLTEDKNCLCKHVLKKEPKICAVVHPQLWFHKAYHLG